MVREFQNSGYWAIIVGGSSGLGLASAKKLAKHGLNICVIYRSSRAGLDKISSEFDKIRNEQVEFLEYNIDATNLEKIDAISTEILMKIGAGNLKCLLHSIAKGNLKPIVGTQSLSTEDFLLTLNAMAVNLFSWTKKMSEIGLFAADARVLTFTSEGSSKVIPSYAAVSAAKSALESIVRSIAVEFAPFGVKANCIQAGVTSTKSLEMIPNHDVMIERSIKRNPAKRLTQPEDVANVVYLLCKDEAAWINGSVITVDGGESLVS